MVLRMVKKSRSVAGALIITSLLLSSGLASISFSAEKPKGAAPDCAIGKGSAGTISEFCKDSCETVIDASKLLISLCTGIFVFIPTFLGVTKRGFIRLKWLLISGFIVLSISVFAGVNLIYFLAGSQRWGTYDILENHIGLGALLQLISFAVGAVTVGLFLLVNALWPKMVQENRFSEAQLRALLTQAQVYKIKGEYDKALALADIVSKSI
jgi:hypothetical protein